MEQVKNEKTFFEVFPTLRANGAAVWNGIGGNPDRRVLCVIGAVYTGDAACRIQGESCSGAGKEKCTGSQYV